jgi:alpha-beta hydrolase superfamily lysophospholipase
LAVDAAASVLTRPPRPLFIAAAGRPLFAWHHAPPSHLRRRSGVVVCPPLGHEYASAYATLRILAERLAALGFDTLRLDYDGTGNSAGDQEDPNRVDAWLRSVECAAAELRALADSKAVALVGVRAGALIALRAAATISGVERLVLWAPFASGRDFVRELRVIAGLSREENADEEPDEPGVNAAGYITAPETLQALERWTLDTIAARPAVRVLLVNRDDRPVAPALAARLEMLGSDVSQIRPGGTADMLEAPHLAKVPEQALADIAGWLTDRRVSSTPAIAHEPPTDRDDARLVVRDEYTERTVRFGPRNRLFGLLAAPGDDRLLRAAIILFNTGVEYHVGPHRLYVPLAREWAARGHLVLRFDIGGIGDSAPPPGAGDNISYPEHMLDDAREAIAFVRKEAPNRPVVVTGLCSGGWLSFLAARDGLAVDGVVPINAPMYLRDEAGVQWAVDGDRVRRYKESMRDPLKWAKALRGDAFYASFVRATANALRRDVTVRVKAVFRDAMGDALAQDVRGIAQRGIRTLFVFSRGDDGLRYFELHARPALERADVRDVVRRVVVDGAGHTFRPRAARQTLRAILTDFVSSQNF